MSRTVSDRFWAKVDKTGECWMWTGYVAKGYGRFSISSSENVRAHRFAYEQLVAEIPAGLQLDHLCRNPGCVNPAHLEPVTCAENVRRTPRAMAECCKRGHPFDEANTYRSRSGGRHCRACRAASQRRWKAAQR